MAYVKDITNNKHFKRDMTYDVLSSQARNYPKDRAYCTVIAVAVVLGVSFGKARGIMEYNGRVEGYGCMPSVTHRAMTSHGATLERLYHVEQGTLKTICRKLPSVGKFIVHVRGHIVAIVNGCIRDWTAFAGQGRRVLQVYRVTID
jgi:hypothetical protein